MGITSGNTYQCKSAAHSLCNLTQSNSPKSDTTYKIIHIFWIMTQIYFLSQVSVQMELDKETHQ